MPKIRGPKEGKILTASFDSKNRKDNSKSRFSSLTSTKDLVLLSIKGNEYCAGEYLSAIVQHAVATHQPLPENPNDKGKTTFLIADEIYWHNLKSSSSDDAGALKKKAIEHGDSYFESNLGAFLAPLGFTIETFNRDFSCSTVDEKIATINKLAIEREKNFEIVRWHAWVTQDNFDKKLGDILPLYYAVEGLKVAIDSSVEEFVKRHANEGDNPDEWRHRSQDYLTEESPAIMLLAATLGYNFIIYPGEILPPFEATKEYFVVDKHVARIQKGMNVKEECAHNKFCLHTDKPNRLVNWLEVNFQRSHEPKKYLEAANDNAITFFSQGKSQTTVPPKISSTTVTSIEGDDDGRVLQRVPERELLLSTIVKGINQALEHEFATSTCRFEAKQTATAPLTQIFAGITQGVLTSDLPVSDQIGFLTKLVESCVNCPVQENAPKKRALTN